MIFKDSGTMKHFSILISVVSIFILIGCNGPYTIPNRSSLLNYYNIDSEDKLTADAIKIKGSIPNNFPMDNAEKLADTILIAQRKNEFESSQEFKHRMSLITSRWYFVKFDPTALPTSEIKYDADLEVFRVSCGSTSDGFIQIAVKDSRILKSFTIAMMQIGGNDTNQLSESPAIKHFFLRRNEGYKRTVSIKVSKDIAENFKKKLATMVYWVACFKPKLAFYENKSLMGTPSELYTIEVQEIELLLVNLNTGELFND